MTSHSNQLTGDELIFAQRMLPHFLAGKSPIEAAKAVLEDDARLFAAVLENRPVALVHGAKGDGSAMVAFGQTESARGLCSALSERVYQSLVTA